MGQNTIKFLLFFSFESLCTVPDECEDAPTAFVVRAYAASKVLFMRDFVPTFEKNQATGNTGLLFPTG